VKLSKACGKRRSQNSSYHSRGFALNLARVDHDIVVVAHTAFFEPRYTGRPHDAETPAPVRKTTRSPDAISVASAEVPPAAFRGERRCPPAAFRGERRLIEGKEN
jgi:hypothetical protein